jgi:hypothetical protein
MLIEYSARYIFIPKSLSLQGAVALFVLYYVQTFIVASSARILAFIVRSRVSMRKCLVMALFATVYWALNNLLSLVSFSDKDLYRKLIVPTLNDMMDLPSGILVMALVSLLIMVFVLYNLVNASKYVFSVGTLRATIIVFGTASTQQAMQVTALRPIFEALIRTEFGS